MRGDGGVAGAFAVPGPIGITDRGAVLGRSVLVRNPTDDARLALDADRLVALLSVVAERPIGAEVLRPIEAAAAHWRRGDKALANLRLVFSGLPRLVDPAAATRLSLAEQVLDGGMAPDALMKALWPQPDPNVLHKYNPDQPRVPAGNGIESGRWEFENQGASDTRPDRDSRIVVAADEKPPPPKELPYQERQITEAGRVGSAPVRLVDPLTEMPGGLANHVSAAAKAAADAVGPGRGPVYGTAVHTELKTRIEGLNRPDLRAEQSYLNGDNVTYGTIGSVRADVIYGSKEQPSVVFDLKTGSATLSGARI